MTIYSLEVLLYPFGTSLLSMSSSNCRFLTCIQISQEAGQVVWYSQLFKDVLQFVVIHRVKGFGTINKGVIDVFLELSCFFDDPMDVGEGNGNPLQCSCLENPRDRGAWWAAVSGVAQSRTRLKRLSSSGCWYFDLWFLYLF